MVLQETVFSVNVFQSFTYSLKQVLFPQSSLFEKTETFELLRNATVPLRLLFIHSKVVLSKCRKLFLFKNKGLQDLEVHLSVNTFVFGIHLHSKRFSAIRKCCTYECHGANTLMFDTCF